jgi:hypothetical protein
MSRGGVGWAHGADNLFGFMMKVGVEFRSSRCVSDNKFSADLSRKNRFVFILK